ncbi:DNA translocase FtsK 4TM domain-containing protein, partial [Actinomadura roseirufa]|uniref:DNA translocase FtsK 4TM domain-containing protein n=1 Tax=Actinomadura roseirufa TaxID=2094049 RepID=UPI001A955FA0
MATRASGGAKSTSRAGGSAARKPAGSAAPRKRPSGGAAKGGNAKGGAKKGAGNGPKGGARGSGARNGGGRGPAKGRPVRQPNPIGQVFIGLARLVVRLYQLAAFTLGSVARAYGAGARNLDAEHRRDGLGLALLGSSILLAAVTWFRPDGVVTIALEKIVRGGLGLPAMVLPLVLLVLAWHTLRNPVRQEDTGRVIIGCSALTVGVLGVLHIAAGVPSPAKDMDGVRAAGGVVGWLVSAPLKAGLSGWVAVPLLLLLAFFGLMVVTATPINRVPERFTDLWSVATLQGRPQHPAEEEPEQDAPKRRRRRGKAAEQEDDPELEVGEHSKPYDTPLLEDAPKKPSARSRRRLADDLFEPDPFGAEVPPPAPAADDAEPPGGPDG